MNTHRTDGTRRALRIGRRTAAAAAAATALVGTSLLAATPASALSYKCATSEKSIDNPAESGPWADNWDIKVSVCSARSGSTVYSYAKAVWDGPISERTGTTSTPPSCGSG
ncbi:hypothetical protein ABZ705_28165 [Streptomyces sp. NPDC006984]|uniref:hypothetical protein n=1 Tax=Streptomyces sp. NPDC006984 TaxID=3155463 RepID=UPI0033EE70C9